MGVYRVEWWNRRPEAVRPPTARARTWQRAADIRTVRDVAPGACGRGDGQPLAAVSGPGEAIEPQQVRAAVELLAGSAGVPRTDLPALPSGWPCDVDSGGFLWTITELADRQVVRRYERRFGGLFVALGVPRDALRRYAISVPEMTPRPFGLLHADLHRDNLVLRPDGVGGPGLACTGWESATYGDPLYDLATHLIRMRYPDTQSFEVMDAWVRTMSAHRPDAVAGLEKDLRHYVAFEWAQSLYPTVMESVRFLAASPSPEEYVDLAASSVHRALRAAAEPLGLPDPPDEADIQRILFRWQASWRAHAPRLGRRRARPVPFVPDPRVPERAEFPLGAVQAALAEEGRAPSDRVFRGTAHINTAVRVPGVDTAVVVRRPRSPARHPEAVFLSLSEWAVLAAIEAARCEVLAPRVLALGTSGCADVFALHTYLGPLPGDRPPEGRAYGHPANGLLLCEADQLIDQICELTKVDHDALDPAAGQVARHFPGWLVDCLVRMVRDLPERTRLEAARRGLPDADRLAALLARHRRTTPRRPSLLHGDLSPWNLVRVGDEYGHLAIIDWDMALIGDPLYDLVRHVHLTPTRPEVRYRMIHRWVTTLPAEYTREWRLDWAAFETIETVRSAYVDLDRMVHRTSLDIPAVRDAAHQYTDTLRRTLRLLGRYGSRPSR